MNPSPGQIGFARTKGIFGKIIRLGEFLKGRPGSQWNHAFVIGDKIIDGEPNVIQATIRGVTDTARLSDVAPGGKLKVVDLPSGVSPQLVLAFAKSQVGASYGLLTILAIATDTLTSNWVPAFQGSRKISWICSALAAESLRCGGWIHNWVNVATVTPQMYESLEG